MKIEIDVNKIAEKMNINKLVENRIESEIIDSPKLEDTIDDIFQKEDMKIFINEKVFSVIEEYLSSDEGRNDIIEKFEQAITDNDILSDDRITESLAELIKNMLSKRC